MSSNEAAQSVPCLDFAEFKRVITERRVVDDHISHALNTTVPTQSNVDNVDARSNCERLFKQVRWRRRDAPVVQGEGKAAGKRGRKRRKREKKQGAGCAGTRERERGRNEQERKTVVLSVSLAVG